MDEWKEGWKDGWMEGNFFPFYRSLAPIGVATLLPIGRYRPMKKSKARELVTV